MTEALECQCSIESTCVGREAGRKCGVCTFGGRWLAVDLCWHGCSKCAHGKLVQEQTVYLPLLHVVSTGNGWVQRRFQSLTRTYLDHTIRFPAFTPRWESPNPYIATAPSDFTFSHISTLSYLMSGRWRCTVRKTRRDFPRLFFSKRRNPSVAPYGFLWIVERTTRTAGGYRQ